MKLLFKKIGVVFILTMLMSTAMLAQKSSLFYTRNRKSNSTEQQMTKTMLPNFVQSKHLFNNESTGQKGLIKNFHYDNGEILGAMGAYQPSEIEGLIRIPKEDLVDYVGKTINAIRFGLEDLSIIETTRLIVYENSIEGTTPVVNDTVKSNLFAGWNIAVFTDGYVIPEATDIFIGVGVSTTDAGFSIALDSDGSTYPDLGGWVLYNGIVTTLSGQYVDADFCVQALITDGGSQVFDVAITNIESTSQGCALSNEEVLKVTLLNGGDAINNIFNLTVEANDVQAMVQVSPTTFATGTEMVVDVPGFDMSAFSTYNISASIDVEDDIIENNTFSKTVLTGDATVTIELLTDALSNETTWELTDIDGIVVATNELLYEETLDTTDICVNSSNCYTWTIYDSYGDGIGGFDGLPAGYFKIYYNGELIGESPEGGNFGTEFSVYQLGDGCADNDIELTSINMPVKSAPKLIDIEGTIKNNGSSALTSFDVVYSIDSYTSSTYSVTGINVLTGESYSFKHDTPFDFDTEGEYTVEVSVSNPNGEVDGNSDNNMLAHNISIVKGLFAKKQLFEHFTSSTCAPCANYTPTLDALLDENDGQYSLIRYQEFFPGDGDPYYIEAAGDRLYYYFISGIPDVYRNGVANMDVSQEGFDEIALQSSVVNLEAVATYNKNDVSVELNITSIEDLPAGLSAHIVIVENKTTGNVGTNGETEFRNVMMAMLPSSAGTPLNAITANETVTINESKDMSDTFVEEMNDLSAVVFIQDNYTYEVLQSATVPVVSPTVSYTATFEVTDETAAIENATITVDSQELTTNGNGIATIELGNGTYAYSVAKDGFVLNEDEFTIADDDVLIDIVLTPTGLNNSDLQDIVLYPNPFNQVLTLTNLNNAKTVVITNLVGQEVQTYNVVTETVTFSTADFEKGVYLITVIDQESKSITKYIVKE